MTIVHVLYCLLLHEGDLLLEQQMPLVEQDLWLLMVKVDGKAMDIGHCCCCHFQLPCFVAA